jgi:hypothetical protein
MPCDVIHANAEERDIRRMLFVGFFILKHVSIVDAMNEVAPQ